MTSTDQLWGGVLHDVQLKPTEATATLLVEVLHDGRKRRYSFVCSGVREFAVERGELDWDYTELTEVRVITASTGLLLVECVLWTEPYGIRLRCESVAVTPMSDPDLLAG